MECRLAKKKELVFFIQEKANTPISLILSMINITILINILLRQQ